MALKPQIKTNQLAKDLEMKSKDIVDMMSEKGIDIKPQKALEPHEFNVLFDALTSASQVEGIDDYIDGVTYIPSRKPKNDDKTPRSEAEVGEKAKSDKHSSKDENKTDMPAADERTKEAEGADGFPDKKENVYAEQRSVSDTSSDAGNQVKTEKTEIEHKEEVPAKDSPVSVKDTEKTEKMSEIADIKHAAFNETVPEIANETRSEQHNKPSETSVRQNQVDRAAAIARAAAIEKAAKEKAQMRANAGKKNPDDKGFDRNKSFADSGRVTDKRTAQSDRDVKVQGSVYAQPEKSDAFERFRRAQPQGQNMKKDDKRNDKKQSKPQYSGGMKGFSGDKEDYVSSAPKEKFQPQPIIRSQTPKGGDGTQKKGATHIVDTRTTIVDLSKYDEKLDNFVPESKRDLVGGNQKLKKQQNQNKQENVIKQKNGGKKTAGKQAPGKPVKKQVLNIQIPEEITVGELASLLKVTAAEVIKKLMTLGMMVTANQTIDYDTAAIVADEFGAIPSKEVVVTIEEKLFDESEDSKDQLVPRAPVVCVMGHVDHGKTSLLDAIRHTNVTVGEAGGITQHIGAYRVKINGQEITFLDTPGHEAFTAMRARGAQATDIAILVVAADDGIMPQTVEAINHAKAAGVDVIVAINKMDKPGANPDNIKQELTKYDLVPEEWGGDTMCVPVSALTGEGIEQLLEDVLLVAEVKELRANPNRRAKGIVIEAKLDKGKGPVATVLVQNGTLRIGDIVIAGTAVGHVRAMTDYKGRSLKSAAPSVPAEIIGLSEVPLAGDQFAAVEDERMARALADKRKNEAKEEIFRSNSRANLNDLFAQISEGVKELNIIIKADVGGSAEAVKNSLEKLSNEEIKVRVIHSAAGGITEGDVMFAAASNAIIVGFNVRPDKSAIDSAERQNVEIRTYRVIYQCIEEIEAAMKGMLAPKFRENLLGHAEVRQTIHVPNVGTIAGSYVLDGKIARSAQIRVVRDGVVIFEDKISSLRRFKDDVREVAQGYECGIGLEKFNDIRVSDILEAFIMEEIER